MRTKYNLFFIGIKLPDKTNEQISKFKWEIHQAYRGTLRPLIPHITLLHPQSLAASDPKDLIQEIKSLAPRHLPMTVTLDFVDNFGGKAFFLSANSPELIDLQSHLRMLLPPDSQQVYETWGFTPHVTLVQAQEKHLFTNEKIIKSLGSHITLPITFSVTSISLFTRIGEREYIAHTI